MDNEVEGEEIMPMLCAGLAETDITPPVGVDLAGGAFGPSAEVLHPLTAQALFLTDGFATFVLISADVVGFDTPYADAIRGAVARRCGVPASCVMLAATHTHGGPATATYRHWGAPDAAYRARLQRQLVELAARAAASPQPVALAAGETTCAGIAVDRVADGGPVDETLGVIRLDDADGLPLAAVINAACHPVTLHGYRRCITPDFPHVLRAEIRRALGEEMTVCYLSGACGDLNPAGFVFADADDAPANCRRVGQALAAEALRALTRARGETNAALHCLTAEVALPLAPLPPREELAAIRARAAAALAAIAEPGPTDWGYCEQRTRLDWAEEALAFLDSGQTPPTERTIVLQACRLGPAAIVALPGELFQAFAPPIRAASPLPVTLIATQANGSEGYFPDRRAYEIGHYEAAQCPMYCGLFFYRPEVGEVVAAAAAALLRRLAGA